MISHSIYAIIGQFNPDGVKYAGYFEISCLQGFHKSICREIPLLAWPAVRQVLIT